MYKNKLKEKLANGEIVTSVLIGENCPAMVEIAALLGFDYITIDCEHGAMDVNDAANLIRAAEVYGIVPVVRVRANDPELILRFCDIGAMGIHVPGIATAEEARAAVRACKYYPMGERGLSATRSSNYGIGMPLSEYTQFANENMMVFASCENMSCINNLEEILSVEGLDTVLFGCNDLSQDLGVPGQPTHPKVYEAIARAEAIMTRMHKPMLTVLRAGESAQDYYAKGYQGLIVSATSAYASGLKDFLKKVKA